jgi:hypothetical protein
MAAYRDSEDPNVQYRLLREEMTRLRDRGGCDEFFDPDAAADSLREHADRIEGNLLAFVANDFGYPRAYRPEGLDRAVQGRVREAILERKYDATNDDLDAIRRDLLDAHPGVHKAIIAESRDGAVRYQLPEGSNRSTNFLTVREMVGLVDYTTNSHQQDGLSRTY